VSLQDINMRKPFRSSLTKDQQIVTVDTRPLAVAVTLQQCDPAPPLHKLNVFRWDTIHGISRKKHPFLFSSISRRKTIRYAQKLQ